MVETAYGVRNYTCSDKTKRPQKTKLNSEVLEKRNSTQKKLFITLENIDEIFSNNERWPVCYDMIFNLIQGKVTKFFNTRSYDKKKELSYDSMNRLYSILKRKLLQLKDKQGLLNPKPVLFFYLSAFFRYVELVVFSTVYYGTQDQKYMVQEPENFMTDDVLNDNNIVKFTANQDGYDVTVSETNLVVDNSEKIKHAIENNFRLDSKQKRLLFKLYRNSYSAYGESKLTKRETESLELLRKRLETEPDLLQDLEVILYGEREST